MPTGAPKACTTCGKAGCVSHKFTPWQGHQGKGRGGRPWRRKRTQVLERDGYLCRPCKRKGRTTTAKEVDHITAISNGGDDDISNLESICLACHRIKTARDRRGGGG
jgi:5-methylcytosine-specific restriction protein A